MAFARYGNGEDSLTHPKGNLTAYGRKCRRRKANKTRDWRRKLKIKEEWKKESGQEDNTLNIYVYIEDN
jgi:hypothetical protein